MDGLEWGFGTTLLTDFDDVPVVVRFPSCGDLPQRIVDLMYKHILIFKKHILIWRNLLVDRLHYQVSFWFIFYVFFPCSILFKKNYFPLMKVPIKV